MCVCRCWCSRALELACWFEHIGTSGYERHGHLLRWTGGLTSVHARYDLSYNFHLSVHRFAHNERGWPLTDKSHLDDWVHLSPALSRSRILLADLLHRFEGVEWVQQKRDRGPCQPSCDTHCINAWRDAFPRRGRARKQDANLQIRRGRRGDEVGSHAPASSPFLLPPLAGTLRPRPGAAADAVAAEPVCPRMTVKRTRCAGVDRMMALEGARVPLPEPGEPRVCSRGARRLTQPSTSRFPAAPRAPTGSSICITHQRVPASVHECTRERRGFRLCAASYRAIAGMALGGRNHVHTKEDRARRLGQALKLITGTNTSGVGSWEPISG